MKEQTSILDKFFEFENDNRLLQYTLEYRSIPMWPLVRNTIIIALRTDGRSNYIIPSTDKTLNNIDKMIIRNPFFSTHKDIVYVGFPADNFCSYEKGKLYDERVKAYVDLVRDSCMIVSGTNFNAVDCGYKYWKSDYVLVEYARKKKAESKKDSIVLKEFVKFLEVECPVKMTNSLKKSIFKIISMYSSYLKSYVKAWDTYLRIVKPRLVVEYCGCFMSLKTVAMNLACTDNKIATADIQVCYIGKYLHSYNCGLSIINSKVCREMYPDYLLTWGRYYQKLVNSPCKFVVIGTHRKYEVVKERKNNVLICLTDIVEPYLDYIHHIMNHIDKETKVYLRLHPKFDTVQNRNLFRKYEDDDRFSFANEREIEYYMNKSTYVFSASSTVVYEALTCGKIVFTPRDNYFEIYSLDNIIDMIVVFETVEEFAELWEKRKTIPAKAYDDFFDMNYKKLFRSFVYNVTKRK